MGQRATPPFQFPPVTRRSEERLEVDLSCDARFEAGRTRAMRIQNVSRSGLLLSWSSGMNETLTAGQTVEVFTTLRGQRYVVRGRVVRTHNAVGAQTIGVGHAKWYQLENV